MINLKYSQANHNIMHKYQDLKFWRKSKDLCVEIYRLTKDFPKSEDYGLQSQMRKSAISLPSNIAEGAGRSSNKDFRRFLDIANGSAYELDKQLIIAFEVGYVDQEYYVKSKNELISVIQMMNKFKSTLN